MIDYTQRGEVMNPPVSAALGTEARNLTTPQRDGTGAVPGDESMGTEAQATQPSAAPTAQEKVMARKPTGFVAKCQCGAIVGALDAERTQRKEMGKILGEWLFKGCTVSPMFAGTWTAELNPCACNTLTVNPPPAESVK